MNKEKEFFRAVNRQLKRRLEKGMEKIDKTIDYNDSKSTKKVEAARTNVAKARSARMQMAKYLVGALGPNKQLNMVKQELKQNKEIAHD